MKTYPRPFGSTPPALDAPVSSAGNAGLRIGVLVVTYNAIRTLAGVLARIPPAVRENIEEVAVFDDASSDATYALAVGLQALAPQYKLKVIKNARNLGYGGNQKAGYRYFIANGFDIVVLLHGDGQYAPEVLHHLYAPIVAGSADAVFGSRMMSDYGGPLRGGMPLYKVAGNRILTALENRALGLDLSEFHSGYRAYDLRALARIDMTRMTDDFHFDTEIIIKLQHQGFRMAEVAVPTFYGDEICYVGGMRYARNVLRAVARYRLTVRSVRRYPEFAEYFTDYPVKDHPGSSHRIVQQLVGSLQTVLDVGCGDGHFAARLAQDCNVVSGIDLIPAPRRRETFAAYACADLNAGLNAAAATLPQARFDRVLLMDVLQHVHKPAAVLRDAAALLEPSGLIVLSLPNVANISVRASLLCGKFTYAERGILDERHLRFFTRASARALIAACGYEIVSERVTTIPLEFALGLRPRNPIVRMLRVVTGALTRLLPTVFGYQWVFAVRPRRGSRRLGTNAESRAASR